MKSSTSACPQTDELRQLLDNSLSGERQQECTEHMESCPCCQERLESVATEGTNLSQVVRGLSDSEPQATSAYWPAYRALESATPAGAKTVTSGTVKLTTRTREVPLHFLQPASDSAYIGRLAQFDVMRVLGRGGMGVVLEAFDTRLHRNVALKVLDPELLGDEVAHHRFCREARAAASITHENVVAVHQVEEGEDGLPYLVMQVIAGESLEQRLAREKKLPFREVIRIAMEAAQGLAAAHAHGLTHRDIKPGNIMLESPNGHVKLTDFGLARAAEDVKLTNTGYVSGTPLYMAPEQAMGEKADHRSDLFSLGAIMYEMCTGQPPFTGSSPLVILKKVAETKHRPVRELNPDVPDWLAKTIDLLLSKKPEDRIQTAGQLAELLEFEWALSKTVSDEVPQVCQIQKRKRERRVRRLLVGIGSGFLALGLLMGWFIAHHGPAPKAVPPSIEPAVVLGSNSGAIRSVAFNPAGDTVAVAVEDGSVRLWDWATKNVKSTVDAHRGSIWAVQYSAKGDQFATAGEDGLVKLWKTGQVAPVKTFEATGAVRSLVFESEKQRLFAGDRQGELRIWALDSSKPVAEVNQPGAVHAIALSPDAETLASGGSDKIVRLWNAQTLSKKTSLEGHAGPIYALAFRPDGKALASVGWDKKVRVWDAASGQILKSWDGHDADIWGVAYSPDGKKIATSGLEGTLKLWNAETGELLVTFGDHNVPFQCVTFNHDGTLVAVGCRDGAVRIWNVE